MNVMFRRFFLSLCLAFAAAAPSHADAPYQSDIIPDQALGGFCSAYTYDGVWGFSFGWQDYFYQCNTVRNALLLATVSPIQNSNYGHFRINGFNQVTVNCAGGATSYYGYGANPLQNAYNAAFSSGLSYCYFRVY